MPTRKKPGRGDDMRESGWWQEALESAIHESNAMEDKIGLARLAVLERLVAPPNIGRDEEDALFEALDELRALDWERLSKPTERVASS